MATARSPVARHASGRGDDLGADDPWTRSLDICIHGHTHRWRDEVVGRTRFINVSTPTAAGFSPDRTMGILRIDGASAELEKLRL